MIVAALLVTAMAGQAGSPPLPVANPASAAVSTAFETCEAWLSRPDTRTAGAGEFAAKAGLADRLIARPSIPDGALPPPSMRVANHYWYIGAPNGGLFVTVSDTLPMCNVIGGAAVDLQPGVEAVLGASTFRARWHVASDKRDGDMRSTRFDNVADRHMWMLVSRADQPGARRDRAQIAITVEYDKAK